MFKKILIGITFVGLLAVLIWGGVNRTLAKSENSTDNYAGNSRGNGYEVSGNQRGRQGQGGYTNRDQLFDESGNGGPVNEDKECDEDPLNYEKNPSRGRDVSEVQGSRGFRGGSREPLSEVEIEALHMALDDEYHALATYLSVIDTFGEVEPFASIAESERRHIDAMVNQFNKYGITVPENPWLGSITPFDSISLACQVGAQAEIANAELYAQLFEMTDNPVLIRVFTNLSRASTESHLPEFQACQ